MSDEVRQSLVMRTLDAWTVMPPEMFFPATVAPSEVTVTGPDEASCEQFAPVLVASGNPHECGLATQSVCRVTGPPPVRRGAGVPGEAGCGADVFPAGAAEPAVAGPPPPLWASATAKPMPASVRRVPSTAVTMTIMRGASGLVITGKPYT